MSDHSPGTPKRHGPNELSQGEIARQTGLSPSTVSRVLNSKRPPSRRVMKLVADAIGMSLDKFYRSYVEAA